MKTFTKHTLIAGGSFAGGLIAGIMLNQEVFQSVVRLTSRLKENGTKYFSDVKQAITVPVPDFYLITDELKLEDEDLVDG